MIDYMKQQAELTQFDHKHYLTAEQNDSSMARRMPFYDEMINIGFKVDVRHFKGKRAYCPETDCPQHKTGFDIKVQAEVDVAIVMKAVEHLYNNELEHVALFAGDGDFKDMVQFLTEKAGKKVSVFSYKDSYHQQLEKTSTNLYFIDEIWEQISDLPGDDGEGGWTHCPGRSPRRSSASPHSHKGSNRGSQSPKGPARHKASPRHQDSQNPDQALGPNEESKSPTILVNGKPSPRGTDSPKDKKAQKK